MAILIVTGRLCELTGIYVVFRFFALTLTMDKKTCQYNVMFCDDNMIIEVENRFVKQEDININ